MMPVLDRHQRFELYLSLNPHLRQYLEDWANRGFARPEFHLKLESATKTMEEFNFMYPVTPPAFIHAYKLGTGGKRYTIVEPGMSEETETKYDLIERAFRDECRDIVRNAPASEKWKPAMDFVEKRTTTSKHGPVGRLAGKLGMGPPQKILVSSAERLAISLRLIRDTKDHGPVTPVIDDPYVDEMVSAGGGRMDVVHRVWARMRTSLQFRDARKLDSLFEKEATHPGRGLDGQKTIAFRTSRDTTGIIQR